MEIVTESSESGLNMFMFPGPSVDVIVGGLVLANVSQKALFCGESKIAEESAEELA